jgi:hypothetical protein
VREPTSATSDVTDDSGQFTIFIDPENSKGDGVTVAVIVEDTESEIIIDKPKDEGSSVPLEITVDSESGSVSEVHGLDAKITFEGECSSLFHFTGIGNLYAQNQPVPSSGVNCILNLKVGESLRGKEGLQAILKVNSCKAKKGIDDAPSQDLSEIAIVAGKATFNFPYIDSSESCLYSILIVTPDKNQTTVSQTQFGNIILSTTYQQLFLVTDTPVN